MTKRRGDGDRGEPTLELPSLFGRGRKRPSGTIVEEPADQAPAAEREPDPEPARRPEPAVVPAPLLPPTVAAALTGLLVGLVGAGLTALGLRGCEAMRGTDSCGGPGLGVLVAILVVMVVLGALVLKLLAVSEHRGVSVLGVGLMTVVVLLTLTEQLFSPWMFVVVPAISAASFLVARWVTTRFVDIERDDAPHVDVR
jgi:hypothetical protein